jgi:hypothetical protein
MDYPPAKSHMTVTSHALKIRSKTLRIVKHESDNYITMYIGGHTKYCIYGFITKEGGGVAKMGGSISVGEFSKIHYNLECSLEHDFKRGIDTNMILKLFLSYIHKHYPYVKELKFDDASYRTCDNGQQVDLAEMTYITTGKTWYQKNFGARLSESSVADFNRTEQRFQEMKSKVSWETFSGNISKEILIKIPEMKEIYENASTWQDFFGPLREKMGIEKFCPFVAPWLEQFMHSYFKSKFIRFEYLMPIEPNIIPFTELPYSRGGRRFTRKNLKLSAMSFME